MPVLRSLDADHLARLVPYSRRVGPGRWTVAVEGRSGAGKTALAAAVADRVRAGGDTVTVVSMDELYPGWDGLDAAVPLLVDGVLRPFAEGAGEVLLHRWDWTADRPAPIERRRVRDVLVVEGSGCGARPCRPYLSLLVWVQAEDAVRRARALARDGDGYTPHWDRWARQEDTHYAREGTCARAQAVVAVP